jgi:glycosyltransferase involved in cell wall biosynthesis
MPPLVSAIVPTYNRAAYICQAIDSALTQGYDNLEIIVVDDGSTDETYSLLTRYESRIKYIYQTNQGEAAARNTAIEASAGEYIALLDSDDLWLPDKLTCQLDFMLTHPEVGMVASHAIAIDHAGRSLNDGPLFPFQSEGWVSLETNVLRSPLPVDTLIVRRSCLPAPEPFTSGVRFGADWEMCLRLGARHSIWFMAQIFAAVRVHEHNVMTPLASQQQVDLKLRDRLGVLDRVFPLFHDDPAVIQSLRARAEAREFAEAAVPSYINGNFDLASLRLGRAIDLDRQRWQGEDLVALICNFARLIFLRDGETATLSFLDGILGHLPPEVKQPDRLARAVRARTLIFTIGFDAWAQQKPRTAASSIVQGLLQQPTLLGNRGVLSTLGHSMAQSLRAR